MRSRHAVTFQCLLVVMLCFRLVRNLSTLTRKHELLGLTGKMLTFMTCDGYSHLLPSFVCVLVRAHPLPDGTGSGAGGGELYCLMMPGKIMQTRLKLN